MHIALATAFQYPNGGPGAARTLALAHGLAELGHVVTFLLIGHATAEMANAHPAITFQNPARRPGRAVPGAWRLDLVRGFATTLQNLHARTTVHGLLIVNRDAWILNRCRAAAEKLGIPALHELTEFLEITPTAGVRSRVETRLLLRELRRLSGVLAISTALQDFLRSKQLRRVCLTGPCVDVRGWDAGGPIALTDTLRIGYSGSLSQAKDGVLDLFTAVDLARRSLPAVDLQLEIVGGTRTDLARAVAYAEELGLSDHVSFHGQVMAGAVPGILRRCHVLVLPRPASRQAEGGFPTKLGEYLATGRPVVATSVGDLPRYLSAGVDCVMVEPGEPTRLATSFVSIAENYRQADSIGQAGKRLADSVFRPSRVAGILAELVATCHQEPNQMKPPGD